MRVLRPIQQREVRLPTSRLSVVEGAKAGTAAIFSNVEW